VKSNIDEESFCPAKVISKYLFDNTYIIYFELEEPSSTDIHLSSKNNVRQLPIFIDAKNSRSSPSPSNSQGTDKGMINSVSSDIEEQKMPQLCHHERCVLFKSRLQTDLKRVLQRLHNYQTTVQFSIQKLTESIPILQKHTTTLCKQITFE